MPAKQVRCTLGANCDAAVPTVLVVFTKVGQSIRVGVGDMPSLISPHKQPKSGISKLVHRLA